MHLVLGFLATLPFLLGWLVLGPVMMVSLYMFDHLMNGMVNPIFMLACGAVGSAHFAVPLAARYAAPAPRGRAAGRACACGVSIARPTRCC